mgnify:CR=1 FL=1
MIEEFETEELKEPRNIKIVFKDIENDLNEVKNKTKKLNEDVYNPDNGLKVMIKSIDDELKRLHSKLNGMINEQTETKKTWKNSLISSVVVGTVGAVVGYVASRLGFK